MSSKDVAFRFIGNNFGFRRKTIRFRKKIFTDLSIADFHLVKINNAKRAMKTTKSQKSIQK